MDTGVSNLDPAHIDALRAQGHSYSAIGAQLGETKDAVRGLHKRYLARRTGDANPTDAQSLSRASAGDGAGRLFVSGDVQAGAAGPDLEGDSGGAVAGVKSCRNGLHLKLAPGLCRPCGAQADARYRAAHPEYMVRWRAENSEHIREYGARYNAEHLEEKREYDARYYAEHLEQSHERNARWRADNPERVHEQNVRYYAEHREEAIERFARWCAKNPGRRALTQIRSDAKRRGAR